MRFANLFSLTKTALDAPPETLLFPAMMATSGLHGEDEMWQDNGRVRGDPTLGGARPLGQTPTASDSGRRTLDSYPAIQRTATADQEQTPP